jgi:hypothetical protein
MIDPQARSRAKQLLERFLCSDGITNYQLEDSWPVSSDEALAAIPVMLFRYFDGHPEKPLSYVSLDPEAQELIKRVLLFLRTDFDYEWPVSQLGWTSFGFWESILWKSLKLRFKSASRRREREKVLFTAKGDFSVWPFISKENYEAARASKSDI